MKTHVDIDKLRKARNIELILGLIIGTGTVLRWLGLYDVGSISPWLSTLVSLVVLGSAGYKTYKINQYTST